MSDIGQHAEWLSLLDVSGPFLAEPVLKAAFPQGLEKLDPSKRKTLRQAYDEWRETLDLEDRELPEIHRAWIELVLGQGLELDEDGTGENLKTGAALPEKLTHHPPEYNITLKPDYAVVDDQNDDRPLLLVGIYDPEIELDEPLKSDGWAATPAERMVQLCRATETRLGLLTNGERWMLIDAPVGAVTTFASWYARLWAQEPVTLQAFVSLLGIRRFFTDKDEQLPALLDDSLKHQDEVTEALGEQVRRAVEVLIQSLDRADVDRNRQLLVGVEPAVLYEAALTVMMRLVFLLSAEERELMDVVKDERFQANYAVSSLRMQLRGESEEIQERRWDAWSRLLAIFRAIYVGIEHETLRMPALGGSLFDPDRFPFLEGRLKDTSWETDEARPLPIDNRTVLLLMDAIQLFQGRTLSYRALDVEQIGYVYEGLLERTVQRAREVTLELDATKSAKKPWVTLGDLESASLDGQDAAEKLLQERTSSAISRVRNDLKKTVEPTDVAKLLTACHNDQGLCDRIAPYSHLLRTDRWGYPLVYPEGTFMVTTGTDRRETGTHYTPKSLTEAIVKETLEPVVYIGPAEGKPREDWQLKSSAELLDLKICDPAMGSGAFLVQVCRWLSERLVEAWIIEERNEKFIDTEGKVYETGDGREQLCADAEERLVTAKRLTAERCIYGVDINPLAVELAKLSIWLVTLAKGRPFGFLDHNLRSGDSLLGITDLKQIMHLHIDPESGNKIHRGLFNRYKEIEKVLNAAMEKRQALREIPILDIEDVRRMKRLDSEAHEILKAPELVADVVVGEALAADSEQQLDEKMKVRAMEAARHIEGDLTARQMLESVAYKCLNTDKPAQLSDRHPFHWVMEFPEVFAREGGGFDAIVGNPPFLGGQRITGAMGTAYRNYQVKFLAQGVRGSADLVAYFFLQAYRLIRDDGGFGLLAVNTIAEGDTRQVGLERLIGEKGATIHAAYPNEAWPGKASVVTSRVHIRKGIWSGAVSLDGSAVIQVSAFLSGQDEWSPKILSANKGKSFIGSYVNGIGFILKEEEALAMIEKDPKNQEVLFPYLVGKDLNSHAEQKPSRWVINFWDWPEIRAREYEAPFKQVVEKVRPIRERNNDKTAREKWWQLLRPRPELYHAIGRGSLFMSHLRGWDSNIKPMDRVIVCSLVQNYLKFAFVNNDQVFAHRLAVLALNDYGSFALLSSSIHQVWSRKTSSTMRVDMNYSPSDSFITFPFPDDVQLLDEVGREYDVFRGGLCKEQGIGLTKIYNDYNDSGIKTDQINQLRFLQRQIDEAVATAYDWGDIALNHGFHEVGYLPKNDCVRYTISEDARLEVLRRLSRLNKERYEEEVAQGLYPVKKAAKKKATIRKKQRATKDYKIPSYSDRELPKAAEPLPPQMDIFGEENE